MTIRLNTIAMNQQGLTEPDFATDALIWLTEGGLNFDGGSGALTSWDNSGNGGSNYDLDTVGVPLGTSEVTREGHSGLLIQGGSDITPSAGYQVLPNFNGDIFMVLKPVSANTQIYLPDAFEPPPTPPPYHSAGFQLNYGASPTYILGLIWIDTTLYAQPFTGAANKYADCSIFNPNEGIYTLAGTHNGESYWSGAGGYHIWYNGGGLWYMSTTVGVPPATAWYEKSGSSDPDGDYAPKGIASGTFTVTSGVDPAPNTAFLVHLKKSDVSGKLEWEMGTLSGDENMGASNFSWAKIGKNTNAGDLELYEVAVFNSVLSDSDEQAVIDWFEYKWNL